MKNQKLMALISSLACIAVCFVLLFSACTDGGSKKANKKPSKTDEVTQAEETEGRTTEIEETQPDATEPQASEPEATEPTETEPEETEPTEPEPTETTPSGGSNVNTGTGGGYNPGTSEPTEPEATEPTEIVVPVAGSATNAYTEQIPNTSGSFNTVKIPAGETMHYRLKTPGTYLYIENADASVVYGDQTYNAENGIVLLELPADGSQYMALQFINHGTEETAFAVTIRDAVGSVDNPVALETVEKFTVELAEGDADGVYHEWIADVSGELKLSLAEVLPETVQAQIVVTVNGQSSSLTDGALSVAVKEGDVVQLQVLAIADGEGEYPAAAVTAVGYVAQNVELKVTQIPAEVDTVAIPAGKSVYYSITGAKNKVLTITGTGAAAEYNGSLYSADESGNIQIVLTESPASVEISNASNAEATFKLSFSHPIGHQKNHHILTALGELTVQTRAGELGYYYSYTAPHAGLVTFQMWTYPEIDYAKADIVLMNQTSGASAALWGWDENGDSVENFMASILVNAGDVLTIQVYVQDSSNKTVAAEFVIYGELYGSEELPIGVQYPGFQAHVPAGQTMYYEGYNLSGLIFNMEAENVTIGHNGAQYTPDGGKISFSIVAAGRSPAVFAITNTGTADAVYEVSFTYPVGHMENPDALHLGANTMTQVAGGTDYYYTFTAIRAGSLTVSFDSNAQWIYAVDNMTQMLYGDTQYSDSDPFVPETTISVAKGDVIRIRVNTYDAVNMFETPAGSVTFTVKYVTGPTAINNLTAYTNVNLTPGEYGAFTGQFYDHILYIENGNGLIVNFDGVDYAPDSKGVITVTFPDSDGSGTQADLRYTVYNAGSENISRSMLFSSKEVGSKENPEVILMGSHTMTQSSADGSDYYYVFNATARGTLIITITDTDKNWCYQITNLSTGQSSGFVMGTNGSKTCRISVRSGQSVELLINTFDPATGKSVEGTVEFTVVLS